jgi:hypothetical protein
MYAYSMDSTEKNWRLYLSGEFERGAVANPARTGNNVDSESCQCHTMSGQRRRRIPCRFLRA